MAFYNDTTNRESSEQSLGGNAHHVAHNYKAGIIAGLFAASSNDFVHPQLILAGLVYALTHSPLLVALVTIINKAFMMGPQLLISSFLEHLPHRRPQFVTFTFIRAIAYALVVMAIAIMAFETSPFTLFLFFSIYALACLSTACAHVIYTDMIGRLIPPHRTGTYIGTRSFLGGGLSIAVGFLVIQPILGKVELPWNYILLAICGVLFIILDMASWCRCREEQGPRAKHKSSFGESMRRGMQWLRREHNYRCYLLQRIGFRISFMGLAFFIPYGAEELAYDTRNGGIALLGGIMVAVMKLSQTSGSLFWGKVADIWGSRISLIAGGAFFSLAPVTALIAPRLSQGFRLAIPGGTLDLPLTVYLAALGIMGFAIQATIVAGQRFLIVNAPSHRRASYVGFLNTITSPLTFLPLAGAWIAKAWGMQTLFLFVAAGGLLSLTGAISMQKEQK